VQDKPCRAQWYRKRPDPCTTTLLHLGCRALSVAWSRASSVASTVDRHWAPRPKDECWPWPWPPSPRALVLLLPLAQLPLAVLLLFSGTFVSVCCTGPSSIRGLIVGVTVFRPIVFLRRAGGAMAGFGARAAAAAVPKELRSPRIGPRDYCNGRRGRGPNRLGATFGEACRFSSLNRISSFSPPRGGTEASRGGIEVGFSFASVGVFLVPFPCHENRNVSERCENRRPVERTFSYEGIKPCPQPRSLSHGGGERQSRKRCPIAAARWGSGRGIKGDSQRFHHILPLFNQKATGFGLEPSRQDRKKTQKKLGKRGKKQKDRVFGHE